jgi:hypothetical protein
MLGGVLLGVAGAQAQDMDLQLSRLSRSTDPNISDTDACGLTLGQGSGSAAQFPLRYPEDPSNPNSPLLQRLSPDNRAWAQLITQLSPAIAPALLAPVTTTGPAGFDVAVETNITSISSGAQYWERGSRGHGEASLQTCDGHNQFVTSTLNSNRIHFSKALPLGVTLGGTVGKVWNTSLWIVGMDLKLALVEGMRTWAIPDVAVRAAVNTAVGDSTYSLTVLSSDVVLSKNLVTGRVMTISPYLGAGILWTFAASELADLTPNIDALNCSAGKDNFCNNNPKGKPIGASQDDIGHDVPFKDLRFMRYRGTLGLAMRYKLFALAAEFVIDLVPPDQADSRAGKNTGRQWTANVAPALSF